MSGLLAAGHSVHGLIVGEATPGKSGYEKKLKREVAQRGLNRHISFVGHREDMAQLYKTSTVVVNLSRHAEPFGRTVIESLAIGTPVVAYDSGGPAESLRECLPRGLVAMGDSVGLVERVAEFLTETSDINLPDQFTLAFQAQATVKIYRKALLQCESP